VRVKGKIRAAGIPYEVPASDRLSERLDGVLRVVYLVFNEGYAATSGDGLVRRELCGEAIRLGRLLRALLPRVGEVVGLVALMLLQDSRRLARADAAGELVTLEEQDRSLWDRGQIAEGEALAEEAVRRGGAGFYALQAAIASLHAHARRADETDWPQIAGLYALLLRLHPSPVVALNHAAAVAMGRGWTATLRLIEQLEGQRRVLQGYHLLPARPYPAAAGPPREAAAAYERAAARHPRCRAAIPQASSPRGSLGPGNERSRLQPHSPIRDIRPSGARSNVAAAARGADPAWRSNPRPRSPQHWRTSPARSSLRPGMSIWAAPTSRRRIVEAGRAGEGVGERDVVGGHRRQPRRDAARRPSRTERRRRHRGSEAGMLLAGHDVREHGELVPPPCTCWSGTRRPGSCLSRCRRVRPSSPAG
jgi:hypothetical protein